MSDTSSGELDQEADVIDRFVNDIHRGDAIETLRELPESSVHMMMTSPPYFGLRDYGDEVNEVWGGDDDCDHEWSDAGTVKRGGQNTDDNPPDVGGNQHAQDTGIRGDGVSSDECRKCGAWRGQLGLEPQLDRFVENLVRVFREVRRVLRPDGSAWLNLGDSYAQDDASGFGAKNKMLVPHRVAIALQDDGWIVRNDVTWVKPNPMPSSVKDRLNTTTEQVFHLTLEPDYYYDLDAIREPYSDSMERRKEYQSKHGGHGNDRWGGGNHHRGGGLLDDSQTYGDTMNPEGKNPGDVFEVTTKPFPDAHFAVFPPELCEKPVKATCPPGGIVLDPFAGAGTTCLVAKELDRRFVGIDLNPDYVALAQRRVGVDVDDPERLLDEGETHLGAFADGGDLGAE